MNGPQKPAHEIRLGTIRATIWRNEIENGVRFNTTFSRIYRDGDQWKATESFGRDDLLVVAKAADEAHSWIFAQAREAAASQANNGTGTGGSSGGGGGFAHGPAPTQPTARQMSFAPAGGRTR